MPAGHRFVAASDPVTPGPIALRSLITGVLLDPLALLWLGSLVVVAALLSGRRRTRGAVALALAWTLGVPLVSAPAFVDPLIVAAEARAPRGPFPATAGGACAPGVPVVVLGGGIDGRETDPARWEALSRWAVPRIAEGARLAAADPSAAIVVSGGRSGELAEADVLGGLLEALGIEPGRIVREDRSRDTAGNAREVAALLGTAPLPPVPVGERPRVRLVTTALHMRRAAESFATVGVDVCAVPVGPLARPSPFTWRVLPHVEALARTGYLLHESVGRIVYRLRGDIATGALR